jgi:hypothetical protein
MSTPSVAPGDDPPLTSFPPDLLRRLRVLRALCDSWLVLGHAGMSVSEVALREASFRASFARLLAREGLSDDPPRSEHRDSRDCWCLPTLEYVSPETGVAVWVHHRPS